MMTAMIIMIVYDRYDSYIYIIYIYAWYIYIYMIYIYIYDMTHTHIYIYTNSQNVIITAQMPTNGLNRHPSCPRWLMATSRWCSRPRSDAQRSASATALTSRGIASCWKSSCSQRKRQGIAGIWMGYGWDSGCDMFFHVFPCFPRIQHDSTWFNQTLHVWVWVTFWGCLTPHDF